MIEGRDTMGWVENKLIRNKEYNKKNYEQILMRVRKGTKEKIKAVAESEGKSVTAYIMEALEEKMMYNKGRKADERGEKI